MSDPRYITPDVMGAAQSASQFAVAAWLTLASPPAFSAPPPAPPPFARAPARSASSLSSEQVSPEERGRSASGITTRDVEYSEALTIEYAKVGAWRGPSAMPDAREQNRRFWTSLGARGARWLIARLRTETHVDRLDGVANLLADIGAVEPIIEELERGASSLQAEALVTALKWLKLPGEDPNQARLASVLGRLLRSSDLELAERACAATRALDSRRAVEVLDAASPHIEDEALRGSVLEERAERVMG